tara:strand:+ start:22667 stop:24112 length:1446 start_codon:yes stop_codon:yes gene_type:complete
MGRYKKFNQEVLIKNGMSPKYLFEEREKYEKLYPKGFGFPEPIDFWKQENRMYGLMDEQKNIVYPRTDFITQVKGSTNTNLFAFDFVTDAFDQMQRYMNGKNGQKLIDDGDRIKKPLKAVKAWDDPLKIRDLMDEAIYTSFVEVFLKSQNRHKEIRNAENFVEVFLNLCIRDIITDVPLTIQGMLLSNEISPMASGLCLEISKDDKSDVHKIFDTYFNNRNYKSYLMIASKYGFMVDKNAPFRLVANLSSPKMKHYMESRMIAFLSIPRKGMTKPSNKNFLPDGIPKIHKHQYIVNERGNGQTNIHKGPNGVKHRHKIVNFQVQEAQAWTYPNGVPTGIGPHAHNLPVQPLPEPLTLNNFFFRYYHRTVFEDIVRLKNILLTFYNRYAEQFPKTTFAIPCGDIGSRKVTIDRVEISNGDFTDDFSMLFFTKLYFVVRLHELKANVTPESIMANIKKIDTLYKLVDSGRAIDYIERYLKQFY